MRAVDPDPGMPRARVGTIAPPAAALFAASGPTIPSGVPVPNSSFLSLKRLASLYPMIAATVEPSAGKIPINVPIPDDRKIQFFNSLSSSHVGNFIAFASIRSTTLFSVLDWLRSSPIANNPISTGTKWIPSSRSGISHVKRSTPVVR